jgi:hypothetical protein
MAEHQDNIQVNLDNDQASKVFQQQVQPGVQTTLALRVEQSKVLEYFSQNNKDTITAIVLI